MKKIVWGSIALSIFMVSSFTFANDASLSCTTVQEWKINKSIRWGWGVVWDEVYFDWLDMTKFIKNEELLSSNGYLILEMASDEDGCNEYSLWKIKTFCKEEKTEDGSYFVSETELDWVMLQETPYAYNPDTNKVYYTEEKIDDEDKEYGWTWSLKECDVLANHKAEWTTVVSKAQYQKLKKSPLFELVKAFGYNWKQDRKKLAQEFNITNYRGTLQQNLLIKKKLLTKFIVQ